MATIPIEIVLQDAEAPVEPTPTPESETNIIVPDTGVGMVGSSNTPHSSSVASIILPAILLVVALATICTVLIHKHHKHQNDKLSKKEKFATAASGTIAILAATVLVGNLVIPATNAATDDTNTNREGELVIDDKITITVTREADSDNAIVGSIENKSYATVYKSFGYEVAISMAGSNANLYLDGDESSSYYFSPVEDGILADNTWGYSLDGKAGEYNAVPLADDLAVVDKGAASVTNEEIDIYYGIKVANDMPAGTYTGELEYTLADTGFPVSLRSMQDMTTDVCSSVPTPEPFKADGTTIEDNVPTIMQKDVRDNKLYRVAKLADGKCWMTQNLDLQKEDLLDGIVLDSSNTDNPAEGFVLPASQISGDESWGPYDDEIAVNTAHVYDTAGNGETYRNCLESYHGSCIEEGEIIPSESLGNLYNWYTATAGTGTYDTGSEGSSYEAVGSICPAGWRLPNNSNNGESTDWSKLFYRYGILESAISKDHDNEKINNIFESPFALIKAGRYTDGIRLVGMAGNLASPLANPLNGGRITIRSCHFFTDYDYVDFDPWYYFNGKYEGYSVRCVAQ